MRTEEDKEDKEDPERAHAGDAAEGKYRRRLRSHLWMERALT